MAFNRPTRGTKFSNKTAPKRTYAPRTAYVAPSVAQQNDNRHSACQLKQKAKNEKPVISGFYHRFSTFFRFVATPIAKDSGKGNNENYDLWTAQLEYGNGITKLIHCTYNVKRKLLIMPDAGVYACHEGNFVAKFKKR